MHWDPFLHAWVITRYDDVVMVLHRFLADRMPTPEQLSQLGLAELNPIARVIVRQMIFMDPPSHTRLRGLCAAAFTPARAERLRTHIQEITDRLLDPIVACGRMDVIRDFADDLPATVTAELMGVPASDSPRLKQWSWEFSEILGNFQHNADRIPRMLRTVDEITSYYRARIDEQRASPRAGVLQDLMDAEIDGDRLSEDEIIANSIITMTGGQETTTNLIGNGMLSLLRDRDQFAALRRDPSLIPSAVEEMLRYESPIQHTGRITPEDVEMGGKRIRKGQGVMAVIGAANRDPARFADPDRLDVSRKDNRHLAFGWASHFCFGAPIARVEGQIAFSTLLRRLKNIRLDTDSLVWRQNVAFRGLESLPVKFEAG